MDIEYVYFYRQFRFVWFCIHSFLVFGPLSSHGVGLLYASNRASVKYLTRWFKGPTLYYLTLAEYGRCTKLSQCNEWRSPWIKVADIGQYVPSWSANVWGKVNRRECGEGCIVILANWEKNGGGGCDTFWNQNYKYST